LHFIALYQELKISQQVFIAFFNEINDLADFHRNDRDDFP